MSFQFNDGGRQKAGFKGRSKDCVVRAIAIASGKPYKEVYSQIATINKNHRRAKSARNGSFRKEYESYILSLGFEWVATMQFGKGCTVHLSGRELPLGRLIVRLSRHVAAVVDGILHDDHDSSRSGRRCVYGYWIKV